MSLVEQRSPDGHDRLHIENWPSANGDVVAAAQEQEKKLYRSFSMPTSGRREAKRKEAHDDGAIADGENKMHHRGRDRQRDRVGNAAGDDGPSVHDIQRALKQNFVNAGVIDEVTVKMMKRDKQTFRVLSVNMHEKHGANNKTDRRLGI